MESMVMGGRLKRGAMTMGYGVLGHGVTVAAEKAQHDTNLTQLT